MSAEFVNSSNRSVVAHRARWRRPIALLVYVVGSIWSLAALQAMLASLISRDWGMVPAWLIIALCGWWITAGIGIRLGSVPRDYLDWLGGALGFRRELKHRSDG
jgi:hypothetical protein